MKRLIVALVLLLSVAGLCIASLSVQQRSMDYLLAMLDDMEESYEQTDLDACLSLSEQFVDAFAERTRFFPFFMRHSDISKIEESVIVLPVMLETGNDDHWIAEVTKCRSQLEKLSDIETPNLENIL